MTGSTERYGVTSERAAPSGPQLLIFVCLLLGARPSLPAGVGLGTEMGYRVISGDGGGGELLQIQAAISAGAHLHEIGSSTPPPCLLARRNSNFAPLSASATGFPASVDRRNICTPLLIQAVLYTVYWTATALGSYPMQWSGALGQVMLFGLLSMFFVVGPVGAVLLSGYAHRTGPMLLAQISGPFLFIALLALD